MKAIITGMIGMVEDNHNSDYDTALQMAIKALSQEPICPSHGIDCEDCPAYDPCGDVISRAELATKTCNKQIVSKLEDAELARDSEETCNNKQVSCKLVASEYAISRQAVLDYIHRILNQGTGKKKSFEFIQKYVEKLPSVNPQPKTGHWIPVSERLPEIGSEVLVCFDFKGNRSVYISHFYGDGEFHGLDDEYLTSEGRKYRKAVAWMPLPKPFEPQESEDEHDV